jgi:hypothetical protein
VVPETPATLPVSGNNAGTTSFDQGFSQEIARRVHGTGTSLEKPSVSQPFFGGGRALEIFSKTRILLVGFGYNETNLESLRN